VDAFAAHAHLIGRPDSRLALNTPALIVDLDALERNIAAMAALAARHGVKLRPHAKTHKCVEIARRQLEAGAIGICCAKVGEAEALADGGLTAPLHITSPVVAAPAVRRMIALNARIAGLTVVVDHPDNVESLASAAGRERPLGVVIDIDPGIHRTGVTSPQAAVELVRAIARHPALSYAGVQFYCGTQQHIADFSARRAALEERTSYLGTVNAALAEAGHRPAIVTGAGTGSHAIDAELGTFTELQVGSYVFMDRQYRDCDLSGDGRQPFETALMVDARVVSANLAQLATIDAGLKAFATEAGPPPILRGAAAGSTYRFFGDEHGAIVAPPGAMAPRLDDLVTLATPHCDPTVNLYDAYHVVRGDTLVDIWRIDARGRSW